MTLNRRILDIRLVATVLIFLVASVALIPAWRPTQAQASGNVAYTGCISCGQKATASQNVKVALGDFWSNSFSKLFGIKPDEGLYCHDNDSMELVVGTTSGTERTAGSKPSQDILNVVDKNHGHIVDKVANERRGASIAPGSCILAWVVDVPLENVKAFTSEARNISSVRYVEYNSKSNYSRCRSRSKYHCMFFCWLVPKFTYA
mgnify:CR=1 FL=1